MMTKNVSAIAITRIPQIYKETYLELAFQRCGGFDLDGGWLIDQGREFIMALLDGTVTPRITIATIDSCLRRTRELGFTEDVEYFQSLKDKGYVHISIDGNNSSSYINAYINNKFTVRGKYCKDLEEEDRVKFLAEHGSLTTVDYATRAQITSMFQNLNKNMQLGAQELRNGTLTDLAEKVREIKNNEKYDNLFDSCFGQRDRGVRKDDEYIAKCLNNLETEFSRDNKKKDLDALYKEKKESTYFLRLEKIFEAMEEGISSCYEKNKINSKIFDNGSFHQLFFYYYLIIKNYDIKNPKKVFEYFLACHQKELEAAQEVKEIDRPEQSYTYWVKDHHTDSKYFAKRIERIKTWMSSAGFIKKGWVSERRKSFTDSQKKEIAKNQGWKDPVNGGQISISQISEYEVDHKQPLSRGGTNDVTNLQLLKKEDNRRKGSQTMDEYINKRENKL